MSLDKYMVENKCLFALTGQESGRIMSLVDFHLFLLSLFFVLTPVCLNLNPMKKERKVRK